MNDINRIGQGGHKGPKKPSAESVAKSMANRVFSLLKNEVGRQGLDLTNMDQLGPFARRFISNLRSEFVSQVDGDTGRIPTKVV